MCGKKKKKKIRQLIGWHGTTGGRGVDGRRCQWRGYRGAKKLKGSFYLPLNRLSTMQEIIKGDKKGGGGEGGGVGEEGRKGRREEGREGGGKKERRRRRVNITAPWRANMRCWDTSAKKKSRHSYGERHRGDKGVGGGGAACRR